MAGLGLGFALASTALALTAPDEEESLATMDLGEIDRRPNNPLTNIWSLTFQNNSPANTGAAVDGTAYSNTLFFQPLIFAGET